MPWKTAGSPFESVAAWRPSSPSPLASTPTSRTPSSPTNGAKMPIAFDPPPTQATTASGVSDPVCSRSCARVSSPITRWRSRTIAGYGCGPIAEPMM